MTEKAPYEDAIEETAKTVGKGLDLIKQSSQQIADIYGVLIGDHIHAARHRRLDAITRKTQQILKDRNAKTAEIPEQIAIPLLEAAQSESRTEMQDLWARLLANAMDAVRCPDVRPEFIITLKQLQPIDALVLHKIHERARNNPDQRGTVETAEIAPSLSMRPTLVVVSLDNLARVECLKKHESGHGDYYVLTGFGTEFLHACRR